MSNDNEKLSPENPEVDSSVSEEQLEDIVGGDKGNNQKERTGQVSFNNPVADLNEDGNVTLHEVVTYNRDRRDKN
ncbi:MAG: hypothetical protein AAFP07_17680 [Cyanobacteria bacterium J06606_4]